MEHIKLIMGGWVGTTRFTHLDYREWSETTCTLAYIRRAMSALPDNQFPSNRWHFTWGTTLLHSCSAVKNLYFLKARKDWLLVVEIIAIGSWPVHAWYLSKDGFVRRKQWNDTTSLQHQLPKNARSSGHFGTQSSVSHDYRLVRPACVTFWPASLKTNGNIAVTLIPTTLSARPIWKHFASGKACSLFSFHFPCAGLFQMIEFF